MASTIKLVDENGQVHEHVIAPGVECPGCGRDVPKEKSDAVAGPRGEQISIGVPPGEEGVLESLMIAVVDKYQEEWPLDHRAMRNGLGLEVVGGRRWKYYVAHYSLYATLNVPGLSPTELGQ